MTYALMIRFRSNESPFQSTYSPIPWTKPMSEVEAKKWADSMAEGLPEYDVTLIDDDRVIYVLAEGMTPDAAARAALKAARAKEIEETGK